jgi:hypothetical protein
VPALSPRTQAMAQSGGTSDQAKQMFSQGLSQMAYNVLLSKLPNVAPDVVTFKVLETDHEEGSGVGAFVIMRRGQTLYVPVVMADNQIKPLDILYMKDLNVFVPLSKEWLEELDKSSLGEMGQGVTPPKTMPTDVDIRNTVVPPTTGRYSYASDTTGAIKQAGRVFDEARNQTEPKLAFLEFLKKAPSRVKKAAAKMFETRPTLLKQAVWFYGEKDLIDALKVADYGGGIKNHGGALYVADDKTSPQEFKDIFGPKSPAAFQGVKVKGYYAKDDRKRVNRALAIQPYLDLHEPKDAGAYKLWKRDGKPVVALIVANPISLFGDAEGKRIPARNIRFRPSNEAPANEMQGHNSRYRVPGLDGRRDESHIDRYIGITEDGELVDSSELLGTQVAMSQLEGSAVFKKTVGEASAAGPRKGQKGIFVQRRGASFVATAPVTIDSVADSDGVRRVEVIGAWGKKTLVIDSKSPESKLMVPTHSDVVYMPSNFVWFPGKSELTQRDFLTTPKDIFNWTTDAMLSEGAEKVKVSKYTGEDGFNIAGDYVPNFTAALRKLATEAVITIEDAEYALKQASEQGNYSFWIIEPEGLVKVSAKLSVAEDKDAGLKRVQRMGDSAFRKLHAQGLTSGSAGPELDAAGARAGAKLERRMGKSPGGEEGYLKHLGVDPQKDGPGDFLKARGPGHGFGKNAAEKQPEQADPAEQAMQQMQMAQMQQPQGPSPVDMAVAEQMQSIQGQMAALTQMQQMVQTIQQRASMIASGGGAGAAPAAAAAAMGGPMDPSQMGAGAPVQGMGGQPQPGQDPNAQMQQGQPQPGAQPGMPPQQGQPQPGAQPGQDPNAQQQQPPQAMMAADDGSVDTMQSQVNPQFVEQAGQLNDAGTFDAAALSSMAQSPSLKEMVAGYLPNLEKSLDNMGRVLLTLWMDEMRIKGDIGDDAFISLEDNLRSTFRGMGDLILKINQNTLVLRDQNDHSVYQG